MTQSHFSLSWDSHQKNICNGLSSLQQNGEFVDMTLAADGHFVKVHQMIMALASPYIKELVASAPCPHPVVFLNNISYRTLSSILEYVYTGEAMVAIEDLNALAEAGRRLHIKGLDQMKINQLTSSAATSKSNLKMETQEPEGTDEEVYFEITSPRETRNITTHYQDHTMDVTNLPRSDISYGDYEVQVYDEEDVMTPDEEQTLTATEDQTAPPAANMEKGDKLIEQSKEVVPSPMQYTVSTQGSLQLILNRFIYYLKHTNRRDDTRQWRCVDYLTGSRCPAYVVTQHDNILQRVSAHSHHFHDKKIMKKVQVGAVFSAIQQAVQEGEQKKAHSKTKAAKQT